MTPSSSASFVDDGWYVGAIILEDFPRTTIQMGGQTYTTSDPLSAVPLAVSYSIIYTPLLKFRETFTLLCCISFS